MLLAALCLGPFVSLVLFFGVEDSNVRVTVVWDCSFPLDIFHDSSADGVFVRDTLCGLLRITTFFGAHGDPGGKFHFGVFSFSSCGAC